jgi:hypothetical protein
MKGKIIMTNPFEDKNGTYVVILITMKVSILCGRHLLKFLLVGRLYMGKIVVRFV